MIVPDIGQLRVNSRVNQFSTGKFFREEGLRKEFPANEANTSLRNQLLRPWDDSGQFAVNAAPPVGPIDEPSHSRLLRSDRTLRGLEEGEMTGPMIGIGIGLVLAMVSFPHRNKTTFGTLGLTVGGFLVGLNTVDLVKGMVD